MYCGMLGFFVSADRCWYNHVSLDTSGMIFVVYTSAHADSELSRARRLLSFSLIRGYPIISAGKKAGALMLIHTHIPKTGGTTLNYLLKSVFGLQYYQIGAMLDPKEFVDLVPNLETVWDLASSPHGWSARCLSSHWLFVEDCGDDFILCYRDPVRRLISDYSHKAELLGRVPEFEAFLSGRSALQHTYMCGRVGETRFKEMVLEGRILAVRTETLSEDILKLGAENFDVQRNPGRGRQFREECEEIVHARCDSGELQEELDLVDWLNENRHAGYREIFPAHSYGRYVLAEARRRLRF